MPSHSLEMRFKRAKVFPSRTLQRFPSNGGSTTAKIPLSNFKCERHCPIESLMTIKTETSRMRACMSITEIQRHIVHEYKMYVEFDFGTGMQQLYMSGVLWPNVAPGLKVGCLRGVRVDRYRPLRFP